MFDMKQMMEQAQKMQFRMQELQEKFKDIYVEGSAGAGLVKVSMSCAGIVQNVTIDPSLLNADSKEMLEDLVAAALNQANDAREDRVQQESEQMMLDSGIDPNMMGGAF